MKKISLEPVDSLIKIKNGNLITSLIDIRNIDRADNWLIQNGFELKTRKD